MPLFRRIFNLFSRSRVEQEIDAELQSHIEMRMEDNIAAGMSPEAARRDAVLKFGNPTVIKEKVTGVDTALGFESLLSDIRYALRQFRKSPGFTITAILTLALGIGATTSVFSVVDAILLKPLPYPHSNRIVIPWRLAPAGINLGYEQFPWGPREFHDILQESKTFQNVGAFQSDSFNLTNSGEPALIEGIRASAGFFPTLDVSPQMGRVFTEQEDRPGHEFEVILSDRLWQDRFHGNPNILGRAIDLNGTSYTVIGIMPADFAFPKANEMPGSFEFPHEAQLWVPLALPATPPQFAPAELAVIGRLKRGASIQQAQAEMNVFAKLKDRQYPGAKGWFNSCVTLLAQQVAGDTERPLLLLLSAVGFVLLIACANIAGLLLTRSIERRKEFTLRAALGAGRMRIVRQLLTESLILATTGGMLGIVLALAGVQFVKVFGPSSIPRLHEVSLDLRVCAFALGVTFITGILFGLLPAIGATRINLVEALKEGSQRSVGSAVGPKIRNAFLVSEVALALILVIAEGLLVQTFYRMLQADAGFHADHALTFELSLPTSKYKDRDKMVRLYQRTIERLQSVPSIEAAAITEAVPMDGAPESTVIRIPDHSAASAKELPFVNYTIVSPDYFSAVGTPLLRGRGMLETDTDTSMPVTVINRAMANKFWPDADPIGKEVSIPSLHAPMSIVGIVADAKHLSLKEAPGPEMYVPYTQKVWPSMSIMQVVVRTKTNPASVVGNIRDAMHSIDPDLPVAKVKTLTQIVNTSMAQPRFTILMLGGFGMLALVLASIGLYGVISYSVVQRTQEIGIRMALGAPRKSIFGMVVIQGAKLAGLGILIGLAGAFGVAHIMGGFLYGVRPSDPMTFAGMSVTLMGVAILACYVPARRAASIDPMQALRNE